jgi:hypothetical protein
MVLKSSTVPVLGGEISLDISDQSGLTGFLRVRQCIGEPDAGTSFFNSLPGYHTSSFAAADTLKARLVAPRLVLIQGISPSPPS